MNRRSIQPVWQLARLPRSDAVPAPRDWIRARVPGAVQLDWAAAHRLPTLETGDPVSAYTGLEDDHWLYRTQVPKVRLRAGEQLALVGAGIDHEAEIRVGGRRVAQVTGINALFEVDLSGVTAGTSVEILIFPAPKVAGAPADRTQAAQTTKAAVSYGWDWHPRIIPLGLSNDVRFVARPAVHLRHVDFRYELADDFSSADITVTVETSAPCDYRWWLRDPGGRLVLESDRPNAVLRRPQLWWTHDHGTPALYELEVMLAADGGDTRRCRVGFRRVRLVMHEGAWDHPTGFPKSRSHAPVTVELNGRRIFARGSNWVNPDIFPGRVDRTTYRKLLALARGANFNLLRCWGGAAVPKEAFFELCDVLGLLVWQEFPLACNRYTDTPAYLAELDAESRAIIRRVRQHPCLALWCGGNELFNAWSGMDDQSHALRLLDRNCFELDRATPFIPTAPLEGMGHGDYRFRDEAGRDIFQIFQAAANTAYSEFGCPGPSPVDYLKRIIPTNELWPPRPGTTWEARHGFNAWSVEPTTWLCTATLQYYFGASTSLEQLVARGEWLQSEGLKAVFEEARRQAPRCAMALNWCFNEPWSTAANNSIVNYPAQPKAAYAAVKAACRPFLASARIPRFQWEPGALFTAELWLLNDSPTRRPPGRLVVTLAGAHTRLTLLRWDFPAAPAQRHLAGPTVRAHLPADLGDAFTLTLTVVAQPRASSAYRLSVRVPQAAPRPATHVLNV